MGLTSAGGRKGCRRCEMVGQYVSGSNHYYYGDVLFRYHHPFEKRTVERNKAFGQRADAAATVTERKSVNQRNWCDRIVGIL